MHITKVELKNFKRFTDLTIDGIPADTKLVLLIGANGSGKSSVFDTFETINKSVKSQDLSTIYQDAKEGFDTSKYQAKEQNSEINIAIFISNNSGKTFTITNKDAKSQLALTGLYGRSSLRHIPRPTRSANIQERAIRNSL